VSNNSFNRLIAYVANLIGAEPCEGRQIRDTFSETFKARHATKVEDCFAVGAAGTTPSLENVSGDWPRPWVFFYVLTAGVALYLCLAFLLDAYQNPHLVSGMILAGSFAAPVSIVVFFMETNNLRNVSASQVAYMFITGTMVSLAAALFLFSVTDRANLGWMGASIAGLVEEPAKVLALLVLVSNRRYRYTLNGLLFGAAVGAGFAAFESAGYAFKFGLNGIVMATAQAAQQNGGGVQLRSFTDPMREIILLRGVMAPLGHVAWTAMCGGMLWKVKGDKPFSWGMLTDARFLRVLGIAAALHMVFNAEFGSLHMPLVVAQGLIAWLVIFALLADGLKQVRQEKAKLTQVDALAAS